ncbi:DUF3795 domain-containing protein [Fusibacter sp. JL216-2]|uniref:DUF3795 domain-containing protein n=1 Tax=Fusibacter sp. JL216-2 TaxID=3071453 RepID=UPI003D3307C3
MVRHSSKMVAPCGMNCTYCYVHHKRKNPCCGCRMSDENKPSSCRKCKIKKCINEKELNYCYECSEYPCKVLKRLDKSYQMRYHESLIGKMSMIESSGLDYYLEKEKERLKCPECGHELNLHDKICCKCSRKYEVDELKD